MKFGFGDGHRQVWPVRVMSAVLGLSASGYYASRGRPRVRGGSGDGARWADGTFWRCDRSLVVWLDEAPPSHAHADDAG